MRQDKKSRTEETSREGDEGKNRKQHGRTKNERLNETRLIEISLRVYGSGEGATSLGRVAPQTT